jgi:hypothetical protein
MHADRAILGMVDRVTATVQSEVMLNFHMNGFEVYS